MASHDFPKEDVMKLSQKGRLLLGFWFDSELAEMHPGDAELASFTVPSLRRLDLPKLYAHLLENRIDACVVGALDKEVGSIHRKVGALVNSKYGNTSSVDPITGCKEFAQGNANKLYWQDYKLFTLAKATGSDHVETGGDRKEMPARSLEARRKKQQRRQEAVQKARDRGLAEHARCLERFQLRTKRKEVHERVKMGRRDGSMTSEEAKGLTSLHSRKSQIVLQEARKQMAEQGIEPATADELLDEELQDSPGEDDTFGYVEGMEDDEEMGSGDEAQAPEPVLME